MLFRREIKNKVWTMRFSSFLWGWMHPFVKLDPKFVIHANRHYFNLLTEECLAFSGAVSHVVTDRQKSLALPSCWLFVNERDKIGYSNVGKSGLCFWNTPGLMVLAPAYSAGIHSQMCPQAHRGLG